MMEESFNYLLINSLVFPCWIGEEVGLCVEDYGLLDNLATGSRLYEEILGELDEAFHLPLEI